MQLKLRPWRKLLETSLIVGIVLGLIVAVAAYIIEHSDLKTNSMQYHQDDDDDGD